MAKVKAVYLYDKFMDLFPYEIKLSIGRCWYELISKLDEGFQMPFMNYGYAALNPYDGRIDLSREDEEHRYCIQLYHHVANAINWIGMDALELGCGRGGGAAYITKRFKPKSYLGIDMTANAIDYCKQRYSIEGLSFSRCDADNLAFKNASFDVVISVEASGLWRDKECTFRDIARILKPNGYFLYADLQPYEQFSTWKAQLVASGLRLASEEDITANVARALTLDYERKCELISQHIPWLFRGIFYEFAGMSGAGLATGTPKFRNRVYYNFVLHKD
ncbi:MAG: methyltransferase domain-containing protein [Anaerolineaceae bacterium]|nr:MAG: methyltransferase domain-containing protein [Anaerolineaceae bacterium]